MTPPEHYQSLIRASDRDRDLASKVLRDSYAEGRLDLNEFVERIDAVYSAGTWGELAALTADLPVGYKFRPQALSASRGLGEVCHGPRHPFAPLWWVAGAWLVIAVIAHVAAAIPLVLLSLFVLYSARRGSRAEGFSTRRSLEGPQPRSSAHGGGGLSPVAVGADGRAERGDR